jgi:hypothetical protein
LSSAGKETNNDDRSREESHLCKKVRRVVSDPIKARDSTHAWVEVEVCVCVSVCGRVYVCGGWVGDRKGWLGRWLGDARAGKSAASRWRLVRDMTSAAPSYLLMS